MVNNTSMEEHSTRFAVSQRDDEEKKIMRKVSRHTIPWLFALGVVCYLDRTNLAFAAVQLSQDLGFSCAIYGLGAALFFVGYSFQIPSTMACRRFGAPAWLSGTVLVWGCVAMAFAGVTGTGMFLVLRVALGLAECGTFPGIWHHLSNFYSVDELGSAYATVATSTALAQVIGAPIAAGILSLDGFAGLKGWQWLFISEGLFTIVFACFLRIFLVEKPSKARFLTASEREWLQNRQNNQPTAGGATGMHLQMKSAKRVLKNWRCWYLSAIWMTITTSMYGTIFFAPLMIRSMFENHEDIEAGAMADSPTSSRGNASGGGCGESSHGTSAGNTGAGVALLSMAPFAAAAAAMVINARLAEIAKERRRHAGIPIGLAACTMVLTPIMISINVSWAAFVLLVLTAAFIWAFHGPFMSWPATFLEAEEASLGFSLINSFGSLGGFVGPLLLGILADKSGNYTSAMLVLGILLAIGSTGILLFRLPPKLPSMAADSTDDLIDDSKTDSFQSENRPILPQHRYSSSLS